MISKIKNVFERKIGALETRIITLEKSDQTPEGFNCHVLNLLAFIHLM